MFSFTTMFKLAQSESEIGRSLVTDMSLLQSANSRPQTGASADIRFSVVIPILNSPVIADVIRALMSQTIGFDLFEVVIVGRDDAGLVRENPNVRFVATPHPVSPAAARNIGIRQTHGPLVVMLDSDAIPARDWLERIGKWFDNPHTNAVGSGVDLVTPHNYWMMSDHISSFHEYLTSAKEGLRKQLPTIGLALRRSLLADVGLFDERFPAASGEDSDLTTRIRRHGAQLRFDPDLRVLHAPSRVTCQSVVRHSYQSGRFSIKADRRWDSFLKTPLPLQHASLLIVCSPLIALVSTLRIYLDDRALWTNWYLAPIVFLLKLIWCFGAAENRRRQ
ncbi:MAG: glycosyltransferase [Chloroflexi bacterium]|nr:glycosyltransferase [Chloroflexota bacterium]